MRDKMAATRTAELAALTAKGAEATSRGADADATALNMQIAEAQTLREMEIQHWAAVRKDTARELIEQASHACRIARQIAKVETDAEHRRLFEQFPWRLALVLAVGAVLFGLAITLKPFSSLGVLIVLVAAALVLTGVSEIAAARTAIERWAGAAWIAAGMTVAAWPDLSIRALAVLVGVSLLVGGALRIVSAVRGDTDERLFAALSGFAHAIFGVLALGWPDVTILVVSLLVGPAMVLFGLGQIAAAMRRRGANDHERDSARHRRPWPVWLRLLGVTVSLVPSPA